MAEIMTIGRQTQFGVEDTPGVAPVGGANRLLTDLTLSIDPAFAVTAIRGTGRRFDSQISPDGTEHATGKLGGGLGYNSFMYPASMIWGQSADSTPVGGIAARHHVWTPALSGSIQPRTFDIEQGDALDAEQVLYSVLTECGIDFTRSACTPNGTLLARAITKATATGAFTGMTATPTAIPIEPVLPKEWAAYLDSTAATVGQTKLLRCFHGGLTYTAAYQPFFPIDSALTSYGGVADDAAVQTTALLELMKDAQGEGLWQQARAGQRRYVRMQAISAALIDNYVTLTATGTPTAGAATFTYKGQTAAIPFGATAGVAQAAIAALSTVGAGNVAVAGGPWPGTPLVVTFTGALANDSTLPTLATGTLAPGAAALTQTLIPYSLTIDYCGEIRAPGPQADNTGLRVRQWDFTVVEDPNWNTGQAFTVSLVNGLQTL